MGSGKQAEQQGKDEEIEQQYWACMELAGEYAYAGRNWVCDRVAEIIGGVITDVVHNHHNYVWQERHFGRELIVIRKGATPCQPGREGRSSGPGLLCWPVFYRLWVGGIF